MTIEYSPSSTDSLSHIIFDGRKRRTVASYQRELIRHRRTESRLRQALAQDKALLCQKDELIQQQTLLSRESDHRLLNGIQMIVSLVPTENQNRRY
jgi:two-component system, sensor histidine kinase PdtaS